MLAEDSEAAPLRLDLNLEEVVHLHLAKEGLHLGVLQEVKDGKEASSSRIAMAFHTNEEPLRSDIFLASLKGAHRKRALCHLCWVTGQLFPPIGRAREVNLEQTLISTIVL
jgi:hypothetical protein